MVTTQTFLTGLFYRFHIVDKEVQEKFTYLYKDIIETILKASPEDLRIALFRKLFAHIRISIKALSAIKVRDGSISTESISTAVSIADFANKMVEEVISLSPNSHQSFRQIVNQAFIDEITCDIGQYLHEFKATTSLRAKVRALFQLKITLSDYNFTQGTVLSVRDVLYPTLK